MPAFPSVILPNTNVKMRFREPSAPEALNARWLGMPRGVYPGFIPQVSVGSPILPLAGDPNHSFSLLKVGSQTERVQVDIFTTGSVELNFSGHTQFPVYIIARAD